MKNARPKRLRLDPEKRREAILDTAQALFRAQGWDNVSVADILDAAGLSKGGFYHHFSAKEDLLSALAQRVAERALTAGDKARRNAEGGAVARLNAFLAGSMRWQAENAEEIRVLIDILAHPGNDLLVQRMTHATRGAVVPELLALIGDGVADGAFDVVDAGVTAEIIFKLTQERGPVWADAVARASCGDFEGAVERLGARLRVEGAACDRLLGLSPGSVVLSHPANIRRLLTGLINVKADPSPKRNASVEACLSEDAPRTRTVGSTKSPRRR
ncbi:DNA-binding transcriptional regulator, AcrR family [Salinihabitans flavidus]|uniref:DNA-binding transcriptional regulator, AcrR family n=1 Tax=Salinihabitans flavidus TaxID=569882 RepID=A0A1H8MBP8_9RHOB|nr:TetR/AcrR family transcriptional regulator [Salinihabitans flavidus]SEO14785.1 DNA-binding transcriptional regulator, AcrR family [Salinihabitans flavidus]